jgi:hypothetical protein
MLAGSSLDLVTRGLLRARTHEVLAVTVTCRRAVHIEAALPIACGSSPPRLVAVYGSTHGSSIIGVRARHVQVFVAGCATAEYISAPLHVCLQEDGVVRTHGSACRHHLSSALRPRRRRLCLRHRLQESEPSRASCATPSRRVQARTQPPRARSASMHAARVCPGVVRQYLQDTRTRRRRPPRGRLCRNVKDVQQSLPARALRPSSAAATRPASSSLRRSAPPQAGYRATAVDAMAAASGIRMPRKFECKNARTPVGRGGPPRARAACNVRSPARTRVIVWALGCSVCYGRGGIRRRRPAGSSRPHVHSAPVRAGHPTPPRPRSAHTLTAAAARAPLRCDATVQVRPCRRLGSGGTGSKPRTLLFVAWSTLCSKF